MNVYQWIIILCIVFASSNCRHSQPPVEDRRFFSEEEKGRWKTGRERFGHGPGFGEDVPIPDQAVPDPQEDAHMALVDRKNMIAWDMWGLRKMEDGSWISNTGMKYAIDGDGVF